jgi:hypothetical protein
MRFDRGALLSTASAGASRLPSGAASCCTAWPATGLLPQLRASVPRLYSVAPQLAAAGPRPEQPATAGHQGRGHVEPRAAGLQACAPPAPRPRLPRRGSDAARSAAWRRRPGRRGNGRGRRPRRPARSRTRSSRDRPQGAGSRRRIGPPRRRCRRPASRDCDAGRRDGWGDGHRERSQRTGPDRVRSTLTVAAPPGRVIPAARPKRTRAHSF